MKFNDNKYKDEKLKRQILNMSGEANEWVQDMLIEKKNRKADKQAYKKKKRYDDE